MEWLIQHHPIDEIINKQDNYGNSPLHFTIRGGNKTLAFAMNFFLLTTNGDNQIMKYTFCLGFLELSKILLSHGADVNAMNRDFEFPIHFAAHEGNSMQL